MFSPTLKKMKENLGFHMWASLKKNGRSRARTKKASYLFPVGNKSGGGQILWNRNSLFILLLSLEMEEEGIDCVSTTPPSPFPHMRLQRFEKKKDLPFLKIGNRD